MNAPHNIPQNILVTGGPGFIGRRVVDRFLSAGFSVTSFDSRFSSKRIRGELGWRPRISYRDAMIDMRRQIAAEAT